MHISHDCKYFMQLLRLFLPRAVLIFLILIMETLILWMMLMAFILSMLEQELCMSVTLGIDWMVRWKECVMVLTGVEWLLAVYVSVELLCTLLPSLEGLMSRAWT